MSHEAEMETESWGFFHSGKGSCVAEEFPPINLCAVGPALFCGSAAETLTLRAIGETLLAPLCTAKALIQT